MGDGRQSEENHFSELVRITLGDVIQMNNVPIDDIAAARANLIQSFKPPFRFHEINFSEWNHSCAYFDRYGAHGAGLTRYKVIQALQTCVDLASKFQLSTPLNIVSIGGGPGNDIIGLCSALWELNVRGKDLNISVTDIHDWSLYVDLLHRYIRVRNFGNVSELFRNNNTTMNFLRAPSAVPYLTALNNADVILMTKVLSIIRRDEMQAFVESIYQGMKEGAFLIFIDSPFPGGLFWKFQNLYIDPHLGDEQNQYTSTSDGLFGYNTVSSKAGIVVLRKNNN